MSEDHCKNHLVSVCCDGAAVNMERLAGWYYFVITIYLLPIEGAGQDRHIHNRILKMTYTGYTDTHRKGFTDKIDCFA